MKSDTAGADTPVPRRGLRRQPQRGWFELHAARAALTARHEPAELEPARSEAVLERWSRFAHATREIKGPECNPRSHSRTSKRTVSNLSFCGRLTTRVQHTTLRTVAKRSIAVFEVSRVSV